MKNKSQKAYEVGLNFILSKCTKTPQKVLIDFEQAAYLAFSNIFIDCDIYGCFFHFYQNIYKNVLKNLLSKRYKCDSEFRLTVKMIMSFAFIPIYSLNEIIVEFEKYIKNKIYFNEINNIWKWFKNQYLLNTNKSIFNINFWSSYNRIIDSSPLTTNAIEGWHRSLNFNIRIYKPNIQVLVDELKKEQSKTEYEMVKILHDILSNGPSNKSICSTKYLNAILNYKNCSPIEFLKYMASLFEIKVD
ncbi:hypothetical protein DMUE_3121 [Dictyocoela muelleri]|nr:hypothetical protein DMUE_3121 [Dictyocoela muelleri]